jgi:hypothetical protein
MTRFAHGRHRLRDVVLGVAGTCALTAAVVVAPATVHAAAGPCSVAYQVNQWTGGFTAALTITNNGAAVTSWTLTWTFPGNQQITSAWNAAVTQTVESVSAVNESYNGSIPTGGTASFGFQGTFSGTNATPTNFALNGVACNGGSGSSGSASPSPSVSASMSASASASPSVSASASPSPSASASSSAPAGSCPSAAVFCDGFENQATTTPSGRWSPFTLDCSGTGTVAVTSALAHTGTKSVTANGFDGFCNHIFVRDSTDMAAASPVWFVRLWMRHTTAFPTGHTTFLAMNDSANGNTDLRLGAQNGALMWNRQSDDATLPAQSPAGVAQSVTVPVNTWACIEFSVSKTTGQINTWVNGAAVPGLTEDGVPTQDIDSQWLAGAGANWRPNLTDLKLGWESYGGGGNDTLWFDDVVLSTARIGCS